MPKVDNQKITVTDGWCILTRSIEGIVIVKTPRDPRKDGRWDAPFEVELDNPPPIDKRATAQIDLSATQLVVCEDAAYWANKKECNKTDPNYYLNTGEGYDGYGAKLTSAHQDKTHVHLFFKIKYKYCVPFGPCDKDEYGSKGSDPRARCKCVKSINDTVTLDSTKTKSGGKANRFWYWFYAMLGEHSKNGLGYRSARTPRANAARGNFYKELRRFGDSLCGFKTTDLRLKIEDLITGGKRIDDHTEIPDMGGTYPEKRKMCCNFKAGTSLVPVDNNTKLVPAHKKVRNPYGRVKVKPKIDPKDGHITPSGRIIWY